MQVPQEPTVQFPLQLEQTLLSLAFRGDDRDTLLRSLLNKEFVCDTIGRAQAVLAAEPTVVQVCILVPAMV